MNDSNIMPFLNTIGMVRKQVFLIGFAWMRIMKIIAVFDY
jgi:hypothetical protein